MARIGMRLPTHATNSANSVGTMNAAKKDAPSKLAPKPARKNNPVSCRLWGERIFSPTCALNNIRVSREKHI